MAEQQKKTKFVKINREKKWKHEREKTILSKYSRKPQAKNS